MLKNSHIIIFALCFWAKSTFSQVLLVPTSSIPCASDHVVTTLTVSSGVPPYSYTVQSPACTTGFNGVATSSIVTFTLYCSGVYTLALTDSNNSPLGIYNHTVTQSSNINISVLIGAGNDTICNGSSLYLYIQDFFFNAGYSYTINSISWSNGNSGAQTLISPTTTTTFSVNGLFTSVDSKTCSANGYTTIVVQNCGVGIYENLNQTSPLSIFPNPAIGKLNVQFQNEAKDIIISIENIFGQTITNYSLADKSLQIDVSHFCAGIYFLCLRSQDLLERIKFYKE